MLAIKSRRGSYHGDSAESSDHEALVVGHDGRTTAAGAVKPQASAASAPRLAAFFFLSPCFRKLTPIWSPLTQASSQRR